MREFNRCTARLAAKGVMRARGLCFLGETTFSPESVAGSSEAGVFSALLRGVAQIVGGVMEPAYYRAAGDGQAFPTRERHRVFD